MSVSNNISMSDKLFDLCEKQLLSIISAAEDSILKVSDSTSEALKMSTDLSQSLKASGDNRNHEVELCANLENSFNKILTNMQFFDEFSQRIQHISEIVDLIKVESDREGFLSDAKDSEKLFNDIKSIFSIRSEFDVMQTIFPEYGIEENNESIELF